MAFCTCIWPNNVSFGRQLFEVPELCKHETKFRVFVSIFRQIQKTIRMKRSNKTIRIKQFHLQTISENLTETGLNSLEYWHENPEFGFVPLCRFIRIVLFDRFICIVLWICLNIDTKTLNLVSFHYVVSFISFHSYLSFVSF